MTAFVAHPGLNSNVRHLLAGLQRASLLEVFHTSLNTRRLEQMTAGPIRAQVGRRALPRDIASLTVAHSAWWANARVRQMLGSLTGHELYKSFGALVARSVGESAADSVVGFEDAADDIFRAADGRLRVYDLPMPHWRLKHALLEAEASANPSWAPTLGGLSDERWVIEQKDAELSRADVILTASPLSTRSVEDVRRGVPVVELAYGCEAPSRQALDEPRAPTGAPLRLLFVGELTQRKGISYVLESARALGRHVELTVVGRMPRVPVPELNRELARVRYIPSLPSSKVRQLMTANDLLLLPSVVEGFGLVIPEALSAGTPVITTDRTGGGLLFGSEQPNWIVPAGSSAALVGAIEQFVGKPSRLAEAKVAAARIAQQHPWSAYEDGIAQVVRSRRDGK